MLKTYQSFEKHLERIPFITIIGKYDHTLGPRSLYSSIELEEEDFIRDLLKDALSTKNKFVILNYTNFYSQVCKIDVEDEMARGKKQHYAIILLRHVEYPLISTIHLKRIEMIFHKIGIREILANNQKAFEEFFEEINNIYTNKYDLLPLESKNLQIRSGINTIQGFCELILKEKKTKGNISVKSTISYIKMMLDSCKDIIEALKKPNSAT